MIEYNFFVKTLLKIIKAMKCDRICIYSNIIVGANNELSYVSSVENITTGVPEGDVLDLSMGTINDFVKDELDPKLDIFYALKLKSAWQLSDNPVYAAYTKYEYRAYAKMYVPDVYYQNLHELENFDEYMDLKASEGARLIKISDNDIITVYKQLIPFNKNDLVSLEYYRYPDLGVAKFIIDKKFAKINRYIAYANLA